MTAAERLQCFKSDVHRLHQVGSDPVQEERLLPIYAKGVALLLGSCVVMTVQLSD